MRSIAAESRPNDDVLLGAVISRHSDIVGFCVANRESLDNVVSGVRFAGLENLQTSFPPLFLGGCASAIENDNDSISGEIPIGFQA
ncbi:hypothetical protein N9E25_02575 [Verrucomicrobiales bacterium]|nr:hypothetical protein [Verrucomicrobiales bacterium]